MGIQRPHVHWAVVATLLVSLMAGCGAEGEPSPPVDVSHTLCPHVDETVRGTLAALDAGAAARLAEAFREMARVRGDAVDGLLTGIFGLLSEIWKAGLADHPEVLTPLGELLDTFTPTLSSVVRFLASPGQVQDDTLELASKVITDCPERSLSHALSLLLARPELLAAIGEALADPRVQTAILTLPSDGGASGGVDGFVALIRAVIKAINNPAFSFSELNALFAGLGLDMPSVTRLLAELELLLSPENLDAVRQLTVCMDMQIRVGPTQQVTGTEAVGALLFALLTDPQVRLGERLAELGPATVLLQDPVVNNIVQATLARLASDDTLRNGLEPAIRYLLEPTVARSVLGDLALLIDAGFLPELLTLAGRIVGSCDVSSASGSPP